MRRSALAVALAAAGLTAWEVQRRRDRRAIAGDPAWAALHAEIPHREQEVRSSDGTRLHVELFGPEWAPSIVLVHGWTQAIAFWNFQIRDLSRDLRVVAYDQRGHGRSDPPGELGQGPEALADDLDAVLQACVPDGERALIAGHSMGGITIAAWAGRHPSSVASRAGAIALINTGVREVEEHLAVLSRRAGPRINRAVLRPLMVTPLPAPRRLDPLGFRLTRRIAVGRHASAGVVAFVYEIAVRTTPKARAGVIRDLSDLDLTQALGNLRVPVAVIGAGADRLFPAWHSRFMASQLPNIVDYVEIPGSGHMSPLEAPAVVTGRLRRLATAHLAFYAGRGPNDGGSGDVSSGTEYTDAAGVDAGADATADGLSSAAAPMLTIPLTVPPSSTRSRDARMSPTSVPEPPTVKRA